MNIKFNSGSNGIFNSWSNAKLVNQQSLVTKLFGQKSGKTTSGIFTTNTDGDVYSKGMKISNSTYTSKGTMSGKCTADEMLKDIGKELKKDGLVSWVDGDTFHLDNTGKSCSLKQLKSALGYNTPKSMEVSDNTITFEDNTYYKFTDSSGKEHKVLSIGGQLSDFLSEYDKEEADYLYNQGILSEKQNDYDMSLLGIMFGKDSDDMRFILSECRNSGDYLQLLNIYNPDGASLLQNLRAKQVESSGGIV